jgi:hypothetical protein
MRKEVMKKWIKALRSGKFKQGQGTLKQYNSKRQARHCCLGVLCELYNEEMKKNHKKTLPEKICDNDSSFQYGYTRFNGSVDGLPERVKDWSGIKTSFGKFYGKDTLPAPLSDLNDDGRKFKTIADIIEKNWESL